MGAFLGFLFGLGVLLILMSGTPRRPRDKRSGFAARRMELLRQSGISGVSSTQLLVLQCVSALAATCAVVVVTRSPSVAFFFGLFAFFGPVALVRGARNRRMKELRDIWPEVVDNLASAVRAGMGLPEAVAALASRGPEPLRPAFSQFAADYRVSGRFNDCLDSLKTNLADPVGDRVCESLRLAREVGGTDLGRLLRTLSAFLREDARTRAELETRQGWTVNAARLAVAAPWLVLLLLATQAATLRAFDSAGGRVLLAGGAAVSLFAYRLMLRIGRLPEERRVLR